MGSRSNDTDSGFKKRVTASLRKYVLEKHDYTCVSCGVKDEDVSLDVAYIVPLSQGGEPVEENLTVLCPNCHRVFDRQPREYEFVSFLAELLSQHPDFEAVTRDVVLGQKARFRVDLTAQSKDQIAPETLLIECKTYKPFASFGIQNVIDQLVTYKKAIGEAKMILAVPATLREVDVSALREADVQVWDLRYITRNFSKQLKTVQPGYYKALFRSAATRNTTGTREDELIAELEKCSAGKEYWSVYQSLVGDILEHLFTPPLGKPISELADKAKVNRRDFILPNYTETGFWAFMREKYEADYVVVDAKNYAESVPKSAVLQIANYLKSHGAGLFGLIVSRIGGDAAGCEHTLREQWLVHGKLILVLDDDDVKEMLVARSDGRPPEEIVSRKIESFRLSM